MIEMKAQQQQKGVTVGIPPLPPPPGQNQNNQSGYPYSKDNRKDSATSPVDPSLIDQDDELLMMEEQQQQLRQQQQQQASQMASQTRFIELSPNNLPKFTKDKMLVSTGPGGQRWSSILQQAMPPMSHVDMASFNASQVCTSAAVSSAVTTPMMAMSSMDDGNIGLRLCGSRHSLHRQSSQGTNSAQSESPLTEVERSLKCMDNGYHEDILEAFHTVSQRAHHQKSLECIRTGLGGGSSAGPDSGPASVGRQTPNELKQKAFLLDSDYSGKFVVAWKNKNCRRNRC